MARGMLTVQCEACPDTFIYFHITSRRKYCEPCRIRLQRQMVNDWDRRKAEQRKLLEKSRTRREPTRLIRYAGYDPEDIWVD